MESLLERLMGTTLAWEQLRDPQVGGVADAEGILEIAKAAGLTEEQAQALATQRGYERLKAGQPA